MIALVVAIAGLKLLFWQQGETYEHALEAFQQRHLERTLSLLSELPATEAARPAAYNLKAVTLLQLGRLDEALRAGETAMRLDPTNVNYLHNVGIIYLAKKDFRSAESLFRSALNRFPRAS